MVGRVYVFVGRRWLDSASSISESEPMRSCKGVGSVWAQVQEADIISSRLDAQLHLVMWQLVLEIVASAMDSLSWWVEMIFWLVDFLLRKGSAGMASILVARLDGTVVGSRFLSRVMQILISMSFLNSGFVRRHSSTSARIV